MDLSAGGGRFSLWSVLIVAATVGSAAAGAGWQVGRARLQDELEQYRRSADWGLPETLKRMGELSQQLSLSLEERKKLEKAERLRERNEEVERKLSVAVAALASAEKKLAEFEGETFTVEEGKSHFIVPGKLALGVSALNPYTHDCTVRFGEKSSSLSPGTSLEVSMGGVRYVVIFAELDGRACRFSVNRGKER